MDDARSAILSRRTRFIAAALAAAGIAATLHPAEAAPDDGGAANDAPAAPPSAEERAAAGALARQGLQLRREGDHHEALRRFRDAYRLSANPKIVIFLAEESAATGDYVEAIAWYRKLAESADGGASHAAVAAPYGDDGGASIDAAKRIADLEAKIGHLTFTAPDGVKVSIDGHESGVTPFAAPLAVNPGEHRVRFETTGDRAPFERAITIAEGATVAVAFSPDDAVPMPCLSPQVCLSPPGPHPSLGCGCDVVGK